MDCSTLVIRRFTSFCVRAAIEPDFNAIISYMFKANGMQLEPILTYKSVEAILLVKAARRLKLIDFEIDLHASER